MGIFSRAKKVAAQPTQHACSFCGRQQVRKLVGGPTAFICDECVELSRQVLQEEVRGSRAQPAEVVAIVRHLDAAVAGQATAKRVLAATLALHLRGLGGDEPPEGPRRVLLVGPRGAGKTALCRALSTFDARLPSYLGATSRLTETGYVGENVEHLLAGLLRAASARELAWRGMLILDGLQHLVHRAPFATASRDISGSEVQRELLRLFDGLVAAVPSHWMKHPGAPFVEFPCDRLLSVATATWAPEPWPEEDAALRRGLVEQGLLDELVCRFDTVVPVRAPSIDELVEVAARLLEPTRRLCKSLGGELRVEPEGVRRLAESAAASGDGAFGLQPVLVRLAQSVLLEPPRTWVLDVGLVAELSQAWP